MKKTKIATLAAPYLPLSATIVVATKPQCKCTPTDACWPWPSEWSALNTTISSALIQSVPPASVCYSDEPNYNEESCATIRTQWFDSIFHAANPVSIDYPIWTNNSCNPIYPNGTSVTGDINAGKNGCKADTYPAYVVNATSSHQIAAALQWANSKNIRVVVKATGHSYTGRSTGPSSLSIWTHNLRGISHLPSFLPTSCPVDAPIEAVRVAAGESGGEIQQFLSNFGKIIVTGANPSVSVIGWLTGGGHGYLSSTYGMGSDNLLEATIVLPNGTTLVTNPCQNLDVFFAIRGGGGGTFGVVTEVVLKVYDSPKAAMHVFRLSSTAASEQEFWDAMGFLHMQFQALKEGGMQGYYYVVGPPAYPTLSFLWLFVLFDKPNGTVEALMTPIQTYLMERANLFEYTSTVTQVTRYWDAAQQIQNEAVANGGATYGSRLLSSVSLSNSSRTAAVLANVGPSGNASNLNGPVSNPMLIGHMVGPPDTVFYYPEIMSLNSAWRSTLVHMLVVENWQDGSPEAVVDSVHADITHKTGLLRELSPEKGAYFNEADANEPDWQTSFFGTNYARLRGIKADVDPANVLWCRLCVGSEALIEQSDGQLRAAVSDECAHEKKSELQP